MFCRCKDTKDISLKIKACLYLCFFIQKSALLHEIRYHIHCFSFLFVNRWSSERRGWIYSDFPESWERKAKEHVIRYCLPDSSLLLSYNPETSSRVTLASLGTVFQTTNNQQPTTDNRQPTTNKTTILYKRYGNANAKSYTIEPYCISNAGMYWGTSIIQKQS